MQAWLPAHHRLLRRVAGTARDDPNVGPGNQKRAPRSRADSWEREAHDVWPRSGRCEQTPDRLDPTFPHACSTLREGRRAVVTNSCALHLARNAAGAEQSILSLRGTMDCFAEPVIGRAFARPVGSQWQWPRSSHAVDRV